MDSFRLLKDECAECKRCALYRNRHNLVFGVGNERADLMFVGEGPGEQEDLKGEPFVGPAGQLLDVMLQLIGLNRTQIYIANIIKCRPPANRDPKPEERSACAEWLNRQISLIDPKIVICLGRIAAISLIDDEFRITKEHGKWFEIGGRKYLATYHPSALLRDPGKRPDAFSDFRKIRAEYRKFLDENEKRESSCL